MHRPCLEPEGISPQAFGCSPGGCAGWKKTAGMFVGNVVGKLQLPCSALQLWDPSAHPAPSLQSGKFKMFGLCLLQSKSLPCGECSEPASTHTLLLTGLFWSVFFAYCRSNVNIGWEILYSVARFPMKWRAPPTAKSNHSPRLLMCFSYFIKIITITIIL